MIHLQQFAHFAVHGSNTEELILPVNLNRSSDSTYMAVVVLLTSKTAEFACTYVVYEIFNLSQWLSW